MATMITLRASHDAYHGKGKAYVARITGRNSKYTFEREFVSRGGRDRVDATADIDAAGLYELRAVDKKDRASDTFALVIETADGLMEFGAEKDHAMKIAKALGEGRDFASIVQAVRSSSERIASHSQKIATGEQRDPEGMITLESDMGTWTRGTQVRRADLIAWRRSEVARIESAPTDADMDWAWEFVTAAAAEKKVVAATIDGAVDHCWQVLSTLDAATAKKVLDALRKRVTPPKPAKAVGLSADAPSGITADANQDAGVGPDSLGMAPTPRV